MTGKPIHLLLIEDNRGDARLVVEMLKDAAGPKTSCSHVETLAEGRDLSAKEDFDLILLDLSLPDGQGLESLAKAREFAPNIPVVVLTGMMGEELAFDAIRGGAQDYLIKGQFDGNLIIRCIRYSIERQRSENLIQRRVEFEKLIGSISNSFLNMAPENLDEEIGETMKLVGEFIGVDRSYFGYTTNEGKTMRVMRGWRREGVDSLPKMEAEMEEFSWLAEKIRGFSTIALSSLDELPDEAAAERKALEERGAKATLCVPLAFDGAPVGFLGVDAVGQKRVWEPMEERLLKMAGDIIVNACERRRTNERNALLVAAVEQAGEAIVITNPEGIIEYVNPTFEKNSGYKWEEAIGKKSSLLKSDSHDKAFYKNLWDTISKGKIWSGRFVNRRKNGKTIQEDASIAPVFGPSGKITAFVGVTRDVTNEVALEERLRKTQKMEAIGTLAGGVAHDFNNILTAIIGYNDLISAEMDADNPLRGDVERIRNSSDRAAALTRQLLAFARKQPTEAKALKLNEALGEMGDLLRRLIGEDIDLSILPNAAADTIDADPTHIDQIIVNLVVNARDAMPNGGRIAIQTENIVLEPGQGDVSLEAPPGEYVKLSVKDAGTGISDEHLPHIFDPFYSTKAVGQGTGLGLSTVYGIVKQHGGFLECESEVGKGTTFHIYFPKSKSAIGKAEAEEKESKPRDGSETIFIVDDEDSIRDIGERVLKRSGYTVIASSKAEEALRAFEQRQGRIHLLLTDIVLPGMNGKDLAGRMRELEPDLKVIFMSGYTNDIITTRGVDADNAQFIQKPFSPNQLALKVREILDGAE